MRIFSGMITCCMLLMFSFPGPTFAQQPYDIAPIVQNLYEVRTAIVEAYEQEGIQGPNQPVSVRVRVDKQGQPRHITFLTELKETDQQLMQAPLETLRFLPARQNGDPAEGSVTLQMVIVVTLPDQADLPPRPETADGMEIFEEGFFDSDLSLEENSGNFSDALNSRITFPELIADTDRNQEANLSFTQAPIFLNHYALEREVARNYGDDERTRLSLAVLVGEDGYVQEVEWLTAEHPGASVAMPWIERFHFVPPLLDDEPVAAWIICSFLIPNE